MDLRRIDPDDEHAFDAWYAVMQATDEERWGDPLGGLSRRELHAATSLRDGATEYQCLAALDSSGTTVGIGLCEIPRRDNQHGASIDIRVDPAQRRRGIGTDRTIRSKRGSSPRWCSASIVATDSGWPSNWPISTILRRSFPASRW